MNTPNTAYRLRPSGRSFDRLPFSELVKAALPIGQRGAVMVLRAYIDDSGTHTDSEAVVMGAFIASDEDWFGFDLDWCSILDRERVATFHMSACEAGDDPFFWPRPRRDRLIHDLREVLLERQIHGVSVAVSKRDWDELVIGEHRKNLGEAPEMALGMSVSAVVSWSRQFFGGQPVALIIDNQENRIGALQNILDNYRRLQERFPELVSATFGAMKAFTPLQAADMLAWESYRYALQIFRTGEAQPEARAHFQAFLDRGHVAGMTLHRDGIERAIQDYSLLTPYDGPFEGGSIKPVPRC